MERGLEKGIPLGEARERHSLFSAMFEQRLRRALSEDERSLLGVRIETLGTAAVSAVVLDRSAPEIERGLEA